MLQKDAALAAALLADGRLQRGAADPRPRTAGPAAGLVVLRLQAYRYDTKGLVLSPFGNASFAGVSRENTEEVKKP